MPLDGVLAANYSEFRVSFVTGGCNTPPTFSLSHSLTLSHSHALTFSLSHN